MSISVIIRVKNEERWIGHAIQSVIDHLPKSEVIIVDNHSTDNSIKIAKQFAKDPSLKSNEDSSFINIKFLEIKNYSPGVSLNLGVKNSTNETIMILSAHCVLKHIDLAKVERNLENYCSIFGNQIPIYFGKKIKKRYVWSHFIEEETINMFSQQENRYFFHNALSMFKKETLINNPFNENLMSKEDRYWINDMVLQKKKFLYDPALIADHHYTENGNTWKGIG